MISLGTFLGTIEAPQPLLPEDQFPVEDQKPLWTIKKLSMARCNAAGQRKDSSKKCHPNRTRTIPYTEPEISEKISIVRLSRIVDPRFHERIIYESYKPGNLREMQDFTHFMLAFRRILPNQASVTVPFSAHSSPDSTRRHAETAIPPRINPVGTVDDILASPEVSKEIKAYYNSEIQTKLPDQLDQEKILIFDSNFECGNLDRVSIISLTEYNLFLNVDTNTKGHSLWFYFAVTNTEKNKTVTFKILNCTKPTPLFKTGMKPLVFSEIAYEEDGTEWVADTFDAFYAKNTIPKNPPPSSSPETDPPINYNTYYTLTFSYTFRYSGDRVYFAYTKPYTVTMHCAMLRTVQQNLLAEAKNVTTLEEDGLQKRIKQFVLEEDKKTVTIQKDAADPAKRAFLEEDQFKVKQPKKKQQPVVFPEANLATAEVLKEYNETGTKKNFTWLKGQDFQIETETCIYRQETLCHAFSGFPIELITITAHPYFSVIIPTRSRAHPIEKRKIIVITARVHAAEVTGSFKVEGILRYLTGNSQEAYHLREIYVFKIVPMLNPEGVLCGNFRCSLTGTDLNRRWDSPDEVLHPQIYYLKNLLKKLSAEKKTILVFCDLHGHSRKNGAFMYGCNKAANGGFCSWTKVRLLPRIIARRTPLFSYKDCIFRVENDKQRTARVIVWKEFGVTNSFTLESSFYGYIRGDLIASFTEKEYHALSQALLKALLEYHYKLKELEKEMIITKGWLKPSRLIELTGTPAAEVLAREMEREKEEMQRRSRILKLQAAITSKKEKARLKRRAQKTPQKDLVPVTTRESKTAAPGPRKKLKPEEIQQEPTVKFETIKRKSVDNCLKSTTTGITIISKPGTAITTTRKHTADPVQAKTIPSDQSENGDPSPDKECFANSWREYFSPEEIENAYNKLNKGIDPNDEPEENEDLSGSDSNPSEDNLEKSELQDFILSLPQDIRVDFEEEEKKYPVIDKKPLTAGATTRPPTKSPAQSHWIIKNDVPSIVITSKNATKAASLVKDSKAAVVPRTATYNTRDAKPPFEANIRGPSIARIKAQQTFVVSQRPAVGRTMIKRPISRDVTNISKTMYNDRSRDSKSSSPMKNLPIITRVSPEEECGVKGSANFKMMATHTCAPTININIKSVNINSPAFGDQYHSFCQRPKPPQQNKKKTPRGVSRVLAAIPKHDESPVFQKLFATSSNTRQDRGYEYYKQKKRAKIGATLTELLVGGMVPMTLKDYVLAKRNDNASFRFVDHQGSARQQSPQRVRRNGYI